MSTLITALRAPWPFRWQVLLTLLVYACYLPLSGYGPSDFSFDAAEYWELSVKFTERGSFSLLGFNDPLRGYLGPLLIMPGRVLCHVTGCSMLTGARVLGTGWAVLLFGYAIPELWTRLTGRTLAGGRWLVMLILSFIFWRDYFNFTLSDMPALTVLVLGLVALCRRGWAWCVAAGLLLAAAINIRPIYLASLPGAFWLFVESGDVARKKWLRLAGLLVGAALVFTPQGLINWRYFERATPLVGAGLPGTRPLYLKQLTWGTRFQRYETSLIPEVPRSLVYADSDGQAALATAAPRGFASYGHYVRFAVHHPISVSARYLKHLFNGLDLRFPTPYPKQLQPPSQTAFRLLNYTLLGLGIWLFVAALWRASRQNQLLNSKHIPAAAVLLAVLLPCLLALPTLMECRFLMPLHLLLLIVVAACWQPVACWRSLNNAVRRVAVLALALGWLWGCWHLSETTARQLRPPSEAPQE